PRVDTDHVGADPAAVEVDPAQAVAAPGAQGPVAQGLPHVLQHRRRVAGGRSQRGRQVGGAVDRAGPAVAAVSQPRAAGAGSVAGRQAPEAAVGAEGVAPLPAGHVGESMLPVYSRQAWQLLKPGGVFLNHVIALHIGDPLPVGLPFNYLYIFPDGQLEPISTTLRVAEATGFELRDVECLREHYILRGRHWEGRLITQADKVRQRTSEFTYRVYRLSLAAAIFGFVIAQPTISQSLLVKPQDGRSGLPLT